MNKPLEQAAFLSYTQTLEVAIQLIKQQIRQVGTLWSGHNSHQCVPLNSCGCKDEKTSPKYCLSHFSTES